MNKDTLGEKMKTYEQQYSFSLLPLIPIISRIDGKCFHSFTKDLKRPYDENLMNLMVETTKFLVEKTNAIIGYSQSDEISLIWYVDNDLTQTFLGGKIAKMTSILASMTTGFFNKNLERYLPEKKELLALFDCRVWNVPTLFEATNYLIWREADAIRNSLSMACQSVYSHKELMHKGRFEQHKLLKAKGINWDEYPDAFRKGTYLSTFKRDYTIEELEKLPKNHEARKNPEFKFSRNSVEVFQFPELRKIKNREGVIFRKEKPVI